LHRELLSEKKQKIKNRKSLLSDQYVIEKRNLKPAHDSIYHLKYQCRYGYEIHLTNWRKHETKMNDQIFGQIERKHTQRSEVELGSIGLKKMRTCCCTVSQKKVCR